LHKKTNDEFNNINAIIFWEMFFLKFEKNIIDKANGKRKEATIKKSLKCSIKTNKYLITILN